MIDKIVTDKNIRFALMDISTRRRLDAMIKYQQFHLMELVEGKPLHSLDNPQETLAVTDQEESTQVLFKMGQISAVDTLLNNWDRLPSLWKNQGNGGNILITTKGEVVAIDQFVSPILQETEANKHFEKISLFLDDFIFSEKEPSHDEPFKFQLGDDVSSVNNPRHRVIAFFINTTGVDIGNTGILLFRKGFTSMAKILATLEKQDIEDLYNQAWREICSEFTEIIGMSDPADVEFIMKGILIIRNTLNKI